MLVTSLFLFASMRNQRLCWATGSLLVFSALAWAAETAIVEKATAQIKQGDFQAAKVLLRDSLKEHSSEPELWNLLGIAETELHDASSAKSAFQHGLQLAPDSVSLHENLGLLFYRQADYTGAKGQLARAVALGSQKPGVLFSLAASRLRTGEPSQALADLKALEGPLGNLSGYWDERGRAESLKEPAEAEKSFNRALQLQPDDLEALNGAAAAAAKQGLDEKALAYLIKARRASPNDVTTLAHFGAVCIRRDLGLDALDALKKAHSLDPSNNSVLYLLARANISLQNWQQAYDLFDTFSKRVPNFAAAYYAMGWIDRKLSRTEDARKNLEHCLTLAPEMTGARYDLAELEEDDGHLDTAEKLLQTVLHQNPKHAAANLAMGRIAMRRGDLARAQAFLETAIRADPKLAPAHYQLSMLFFREHNLKRAETEKALAASLNAQANRAGKTQLKLILPETDTVP